MIKETRSEVEVVGDVKGFLAAISEKVKIIK